MEKILFQDFESIFCLPVAELVREGGGNASSLTWKKELC